LCPPHTNPAEFFVDTITIDFGNGISEEKLVELEKGYADSSMAASLKANSRPSEVAADGAQMGSEIIGMAGPCKQFVVLLHRMLTMSYKNPYIWAIRLVMYIALSFMVGTMYWKVGEVMRTQDVGVIGSDKWQEVRRAAYSLLPLLFYVQAFLVFMSVAVLPFFGEQRDVFRRERANGQITCLPYVVADFFAGLPGITLIAVISSALVVLLTDLNGFGGFFLNLLLSLVAAEALMHMIGAAQPHYIIGMAFGAGLFGMFMLCEGFMVPYSVIPDGWLWGYYIAFHTYSFEWFMHNQFSGTDGGFFGVEILKEYGMTDVKPLQNGLILGGYALIFEIGFFLVLFIFHTGRR